MLFRAVVVTMIVVEADDETTAWQVVEQSARCPTMVGIHFGVKQHTPEIKIVAPALREDG